MDALEFAMMYQALADWQKPGPLRDAMLAQRDQCLAEAPAEMERQMTMSRWLFNETSKTITGGEFTIPISYE